MQDKFLYEYAIIRVVPKVDREEFINVGLIVFSKRLKALLIKYQIPEQKIKCFCTEFDIDQLKLNLEAFELVCTDKKNRSPISQLEIDEKFRWITAVKSSSIQTSRPHPGYTTDIHQTFEKLYNDLVL
jgi:hypothetical protein